MQKLNVGLIVTLSGRWPRPLPEQRLQEYRSWANENLTDMNVIIPEHVLSTPMEVQEAIREMKRQLVDVVVMVYGAFTGDDIAASIVQQMQVPLILWAPHEPPFEREERLLANALCSMTMNASALHRLGYPYHAVYGGIEDPRGTGKVLALLRGYLVRKNMASLSIGLFGYRPTNYYVSTFNEADIRRTFGASINETDLKTVFDVMASLNPEEVEADMADVSARWNPSKLPEGHLENHSRLYLALKQQMKTDGYDCAILKCWPEMGNLHTTPCAVIGRLTDEGIHVGCEGDVDAEITQMMMYFISGKPTFITDMINVIDEENVMTFWHCGNAAPSLHQEKYHPEIRNHPLLGQGTAFWTALKPGRVTICRLHDDNGQYRMALMSGEALDRDRDTRGSMAFVRMDHNARDIAERLICEGFPHHVVLLWGDYREELRTAASLMSIPVLEL